MQETKSPGRPQRARLVVPSRSDLLLKNFTEVIGGPMGARSAPGLLSPGVFTVERVLIILTVLAALASLAVKSYCRTNGWHTPGQFYSTCYSDFPEFFRNRGLGEDPFTFLSQGNLFEYPALLGFIAGAVAWLIPGDGVTDSRVLGYFDANATLIAAVWIVTVLATARMSQRRPWDAAMVALAPCIVLAGTINWDLWAVGLLAAGMLCFARERLVPAGILFGLAVATKPYAALILAAIFLLAVRTGRIRAFLVTAGTAMVAWLAVNIPVAVANPAGWRHSLGATQSQEAGYGSVWFAYNLAARRLRWQVLDPAAINVLALTFFLLACAAVAFVALTAPRRPRLAQLAFLLVAALILTNKVYSPQYVLWLIPLLALARPRWRDFLVWQGAEGLYWAAIWMFLAQVTSQGPTQHNIDMPYYVLAVAAHMFATAYLILRVVWDIYDPKYDPLRRHHLDDPHGGPFDGLPDHLRFSPFRRSEAVLPRRAKHHA
ncbi:glycosyltransferase 87 family protein [Pseudarthrobacter sulfonivorans]|uniref:glycosyltransferase family 87 protein n=1 Tax=Pseudarthrobacter sulfonivorans TaxID=121292 RepID=UPI0028638680|nr:glycosyltransferase 87 family protein [Pseudarthrobacter sulfonivorans]MDR6416683.1 putative membrane protein [Pseudarthrobacter sulfonivorans]